MATNDIQSDVFQINCSKELLSPSELFQRRIRNNKIPVRGQKEFLPDNSVRQKTCLQKTLDEHWTLVTEERVERVGNLVNAEWIPEEKLVKLKTPAGKFWQTMGFSFQGKQCLFPEEALYLMECGNVQVFSQDLPLSIQEGYECFLSAEAVTYHEYLVFSHLKRLGYVVKRFDAGLPSLYKQRLNPPLSNNRPGKQLKRKWSQSHNFGVSPEVSAGQLEGEVKTRVSCSNLEGPGQLQTQQAFHEERIKCYPESDRDSGRNWWTDTSSQSQPDSLQLSVPRWDFSCIFFPDLGSYNGSCTCLPPPDPSLLPGALQVPECHMAHWHRKINLKDCRPSQKRHREENRYTCNSEDQVCWCRNWVEHLERVEKRKSPQPNERSTNHKEQEAMPLVQPGQCRSHRELLDQVNIIQPYALVVGNSSLPRSDQWRITYDIYQPDTEFKKCHPGKPYTRLCVCSFDGPVPDLHVLKQLSIQSRDVPVTFAVVDHGDISFYCFKEFNLPTDVY